MENSDHIDPNLTSNEKPYALPSFEEIKFQLGAVVESYISENRPVYLDTFGIVFPLEKEITKRYELRDRLVIRRDLVRSVAFEKCSDLTNYHRERFINVVETPELSSRILLLADNESTKLSNKEIFLRDREMRKKLREVTRKIREEAIEFGRSRSLDAVGEIFSTHNRQGKSPADWFAGADIFIKPSFQKTILMGREHVYEKPVLRDAWEPLEALFGSPIRTWTLDLKRMLKGLGLNNDGDFPFAKVAAFERKDPRGGSSLLIFCSDGLRVPGIDGAGQGSEVIFQTEWNGHGEIPSWPLVAFTLSWLLISSASSKRLRQGSGLGVGESLSGDKNSVVTHIFTTPCGLLPGNHYVSSGSFEYISIVGITEDEAEWAQHFSSSYLQTILNAKGQDQITRSSRSSLVRGTLLQSERNSTKPLTTTPSAPIS